MKYLIIVLFPFLAFAQKTKAKPDTCFTQQEISDISFVLDSLWAADDINNELITKYQKLSFQQDSLILQCDSQLLMSPVQGSFFYKIFQYAQKLYQMRL